MKIEEYKSKIDGLLQNPDTALANVAEIYKELEADLTTLESLRSSIESHETEKAEYEKRIKDLQETNMKLYLSTGTAREPEEIDTVSEAQKNVEAFFDSFNKEEE